jgi:rubrerythrin
MKNRVSENIENAFKEASKTAARNRAFAFQAQNQGRSDLARLFRAIADAKSVQARRFLGHMKGKIASTDENLSEALENERRVLKDLYPAMARDAEGAPWAVQKAFHQTIKVSSRHLDLFRRVMEEGDSEIKATLYVCRICGHISENGIPDNCPVCHAVKGRFVEAF